MNDTQPDAWFYSREGERLGPVTFEELKLKATEAGLNPRLDMVWTHGMPEWKPAGEVEGLFERRTAPEGQEGSTSADPYSPPEHDSPEELTSEDGEWPGARRRRFIFTIIAVPFLLNLGGALTMTLFQKQFGPELAGMIMIGVMILMVVIVIHVSLQRLVNLGMSRWWYLGNFVPFLNLWVGYRSFACPAGYAYHKKLDGAGVFLAIVYWGMFLLTLLAIAAAVALLMGALGSPELKEQFQEILQKAAQPKS